MLEYLELCICGLGFRVLHKVLRIHWSVHCPRFLTSCSLTEKTVQTQRIGLMMHHQLQNQLQYRVMHLMRTLIKEVRRVEKVDGHKTVCRRSSTPSLRLKQ